MKKSSIVNVYSYIGSRVNMPMFVSNLEFKNMKNRANRNLLKIDKANNYLQSDVWNMEFGGELMAEYVKKLKNVLQTPTEDTNLKKFEKSSKFQKNKKARYFSATLRKKLERANKNIPSNIFDYFHPYEYYYLNKTIKSSKSKKSNNKKLILSCDIDNNIKSYKRPFKMSVDQFRRLTNILNTENDNKTELNEKIKLKNLIFSYNKNNALDKNLNKLNLLQLNSEPNRKLNLKDEEKKSIKKNFFLSLTTDNTNRLILSTRNTNNNTTINSKILFHKKNKKEIINKMDNINDNLEEIKTDIEEYISQQNPHQNDNNENDMIKKILKPSTKKYNYTAKDIFRNMEPTNNIKILNEEYSSLKKGKITTAKEKELVKNINRIAKLEKIHDYQRNEMFKKNIFMKINVNQLKENSLAKERKIFGEKIDYMKQMNINLNKYFIKVMKK